LIETQTMVLSQNARLRESCLNEGLSGNWDWLLNKYFGKTDLVEAQR